MKDDEKSEQTAETSAENSLETERLCIVGIGASAGGLEAIREMLANAPTDANLAYVVIQHLDPGRCVRAQIGGFSS